MSVNEIVEFRCENCNELLLRGVSTTNNYNDSIQLRNIKPRKNTIIKRFDFEVDEYSGDMYSPEQTIKVDFTIDAICRSCGTLHENIVNKSFYKWY